MHYFLSHVRSRTGRIHLSPDHIVFLYKTGGTCLLQTKQMAGKQLLPISALDALSGNSQNLLRQSKMCHRSHRLWILFFPPLPRLLRKVGNPIRFLLPPPGFFSETDDCSTDEIYLLLEGPLDRKLPGMSANPTITGNLLIHTFHCRLKSHSWKRFWDYDTFVV